MLLSGGHFAPAPKPWSVASFPQYGSEAPTPLWKNPSLGVLQNAASGADLSEGTGHSTVSLLLAPVNQLSAIVSTIAMAFDSFSYALSSVSSSYRYSKEQLLSMLALVNSLTANAKPSGSKKARTAALLCLAAIGPIVYYYLKSIKTKKHRKRTRAKNGPAYPACAASAV